MAEQYAIDNNAKAVKFVTLEIGAMTGVVPHYVRDYYDDVVEGTLLEGSELKIEEVPGLIFCRECGNSFEPVNDPIFCPKCQAKNYEIIDGNKLLLKEIGFI